MLAELTPDVKYPRLIKSVELGNQIARCIVRLSSLFLANVNGSGLGAETNGTQYSHVGGFDWAKKNSRESR